MTHSMRSNFMYKKTKAWMAAVGRAGSLVVLVLLLLLGQAGGMVGQALLQDGAPLQNMAIHPNTGHIYVGGVNRIFKLDSSLNSLQNETTGPQPDNVACQPTGDCTAPKTSTDNYNRVLLLYGTSLVQCGSIYQGICSLHQQSNINNKSPKYIHQVATNSRDHATVAFVGKGPSSDGDIDVLYVASSYVNYVDPIAQSLRSDVPALSTRNLISGEEFTYLYKNSLTRKGSYVKFNTALSTAPTTKYVTGFTSEGYIYFLLTQTDYDNPVSKIVQLCKDDKQYYSYIETKLKCTKNSVDYPFVQSAVLTKTGSLLAATLSATTSNDVIFALFSKTQDDTSDSALCVYSMQTVRDRFQSNLAECQGGKGGPVVTLKSIKGSDCTTSSSTDACAGASVSPLNGTVDITADAAKVWPGVRTTAIQVSPVLGVETVAFVATSNGHLKKLVVNSYNDGEEYLDEVVQDGIPIHSVQLDSSQQHLYVMTDNQVHKLPVQRCSQKTDCDSCKRAKDPYCGWCSLEKRCSTKSSCTNSDLQKRWLSRNSWDCFKKREIRPLKASLLQPTQVVISLSILPALDSGHRYQCKFGSVVVGAQTQQSSTNLTCTTPIQQLPRLGQGSDSYELTLSVMTSEISSVALFEEPFTFYDCTVHKSCSACAATSWGCDWCIHENRCTDQSSQCSGSLVYGKQTKHNVFMDSRGPDFCPRLDQTRAILMPVNVDKDFSLRATNLPVPANGLLGYQCNLLVEGAVIGSISGRRQAENLLLCDSHMWSYLQNKKQMVAQVQVTWNQGFRIEDPHQANVTLYKCGVMGPDCSTCLGLEDTQAEFGCKFCSGNCVYESQCGTPRTSCPRHEILKVSPLSATIEGNALITIDGKELGKRKDDIKDSVTLAGHKCDVQEYQVSKRIVCRARASGREKIDSVEVTIDNFRVTYSTKFEYRDPVIESIYPNKGPMAGGTRLVVNGTKLKTGATENMRAQLGGVNCTIVSASITDNQLICITSTLSSPKDMNRFSIIFDGNAKRHLDQPYIYNYTMDPNISNITPLKSFSSGGKTITVTGTNLDSVLQPKMYFHRDNSQTEKMLCKIVSDKKLECPAPSDKEVFTRRRRAAEQWQVGFEMDGVQSVQDIEKNFPGVQSTMEIYPDPRLKEFEGKNRKQEYRGQPGKDPLILEGSNLDSGAVKSDYKVTIGNWPCDVVELTESRLLCRPPDKQPDPDPKSSDKLPRVKVQIGRNLQQDLGVVEYVKPGTELQTPAIIGIAVAGAVLFLIIIIILTVYRHKATEAERQYKRIQKQLDELESSVRQECKQAFAELQTDMSDLTSDLNSAGIPFWDYSTYTFKVLFPSLVDHPVLHPDPMNANSQFGSLDPGVAQFSQLLNNKQFLLIFIKTLEARKDFSVRDRSVVASLLMIVLQDKMEYATEILKALLNELIDRSVEKKIPKLMLRRTESVVEKFLTNWLSLSLYSYIKKNAGRSLFLLYKALKHQTEKGPVDAITSESRYSLSEDKLLREKIEPTPLVINVAADTEHEPVPCRVLDIDSITQAKEKMLDAIYKNTPFSRRPSVHDVDLEWRSGRSGHLPLQDDDVTTDIKSGWKKVNTLAHYYVPDGASMALVLRPRSDTGIRNVNGMVELTGTSLSSVTPIITMEEGSKAWHLVKHDDNQNSSRTTKVISEIFLTRLLSTKGTLQKFIDDLFRSMFTVGPDFPPAIKFLFDFLDQAARRHNIVDADVVHTWKSNSLPLRFWVNLIKNPDFIMDVNKPHIVDSCLSVIAQTLMDSCSTTDHKLGKDSPSNKLLFAKDIPRYKDWILKYYKGIQDLPQVTDRDINKLMTELSKNNTTCLNVSVALRQLFKYAHQYRFELLETLDEDSSAQRLHLRERFEQVNAAMNRPNVGQEQYPEVSARL